MEEDVEIKVEAHREERKAKMVLAVACVEKKMWKQRKAIVRKQWKWKQADWKQRADSGCQRGSRLLTHKHLLPPIENSTTLELKADLENLTIKRKYLKHLFTFRYVWQWTLTKVRIASGDI